ncbi:MAG: hypothetical protein JWM80_6077 [Cyanobacteria bacterium RYN_339]|nr:hypothetical protein [Cyanobacteria bacterium RYN_339]
MIRTPEAKQAPKTGPLSPLEIGQFSYRDGVWYVQAKPAPKTKR